jgi:hypothetical protein
LAGHLLFFTSEVAMLAEDTLIADLVEVSGWDEDELFFVEKSELACDNLAGKSISLRRTLPNGSLVFLRLLNSHTSRSSTPIAFEAHFIGRDARGLNQFSLLPAHPRHSASCYRIH